MMKMCSERKGYISETVSNRAAYIKLSEQMQAAVAKVMEASMEQALFFARGDYFSLDDPKLIDDSKLLVAQALLPEVDPEFLVNCGLESMDELPLDRERMEVFCKEGKPVKKGQRQFQIVIDQEGAKWLLKIPPFFYWQTDRSGKNFVRSSKSTRLTFVRLIQSEVFLYRMGQLLGYPVEETKIVIRGGLPCTAYRYMGDNIAWPEIAKRNPDLKLLNPMDAKMRFLFNLFANLRLDDSFQGIVGEGKYYAGDIYFNPDLLLYGGAKFVDDDKFVADGLKYMRERKEVFGANDMLESLQSDPEVRAYVRRFIVRAKAIAPDQLEEVFADFIGSDDERRILKEEFLRRGQLLERIMSVLMPEQIGTSKERFLASDVWRIVSQISSRLPLR